MCKYEIPCYFASFNETLDYRFSNDVNEYRNYEKLEICYLENNVILVTKIIISQI